MGTNMSIDCRHTAVPPSPRSSCSRLVVKLILQSDLLFCSSNSRAKISTNQNKMKKKQSQKILIHILSHHQRPKLLQKSKMQKIKKQINYILVKTLAVGDGRSYFCHIFVSRYWPIPFKLVCFITTTESLGNIYEFFPLCRHMLT